uniref:Uncharacterized protein n=1 Tax=Steinernema glaseri TaxID=37863 RepID=A0A1I7ZY86_9BILA
MHVHMLLSERLDALFNYFCRVILPADFQSFTAALNSINESVKKKEMSTMRKEFVNHLFSTNMIISAVCFYDAWRPVSVKVALASHSFYSTAVVATTEPVVVVALDR